MMCTSYTKHEKIVIVLACTVGIIVYWKSGINGVLKAAIYLFALKGVDWNKYWKWVLSVLLAGSVLLFARGCILRTDTWLFYIDSRDNRGFEGARLSLGYGHPNRLMSTVLYGMLIAYIYIQDQVRKKFLIVWTVFLLGSIVLYYLTDTRTFLCIILLVLLLFLLKEYIPNNMMNVMTGIIFIGTYISLLVISFLGARSVKSDRLLIFDNRVLSGRINTISNSDFCGEYPFGLINNWILFGNSINRAPFDFGYVFVFYFYGIIAGLVFIGVIGYTFYQLYKQKKSGDIIILLGMVMHTFMEIYIFSNYITKNMLLLFCSYALWTEKRFFVKGEKDKDESDNFCSANI